MTTKILRKSSGSKNKDSPVVFTGTTKEYFGIWIVNLLLSIITFGIYSAWAKVRTKKYFANNTLIAGSAFDYHASPIKILKSRIIILIGYIVFTIIAKNSISISIIFYTVFLLLFPAIIIRARRFNLFNHSYKGIRFGFKGKYGDACLIYILYPFISFITLGLAIPYLQLKAENFKINNSFFGRSPFRFSANIKDFYLIYLAGFIAGIVITGFLSFWVYVVTKLIPINVDSYTPIIVGLSILGFLFGLGYSGIQVMNYAYNSVSIDHLKFKATLNPRKYIWISFTNLIAIIFSIGFMIPWARIRTSKFFADNIFISGSYDLDQFISDIKKEVSPIGDATSDFLDMDDSWAL